MQKLTNEVRAELKARFGPDLKVVELEDHEDLALVINRPSLKAWGVAFDELAKPPNRADAIHNLLIDCAVWPEGKDLAQLLDFLPALPDVLWPVLADLAGSPRSEIKLVEINRLSAEDRENLLAAGITEARLGEFGAAYPRPGQLWAALLPIGVWILRKPGSSQYNAFRRLSTQGKVFEGLFKMTLGSVLWPGEDVVAATSERAPGLLTAIGEALMEKAGEGARARLGGI